MKAGSDTYYQTEDSGGAWGRVPDAAAAHASDATAYPAVTLGMQSAFPPQATVAPCFTMSNLPFCSISVFRKKFDFRGSMVLVILGLSF